MLTFGKNPNKEALAKGQHPSQVNKCRLWKCQETPHLRQKLGIERMQIQESGTEVAAGRIFATATATAAAAIVLPGPRITRPRRRRRLQQEFIPTIESPLRIPIHPRPLPTSTTATVESIVLLFITNNQRAEI